MNEKKKIFDAITGIEDKLIEEAKEITVPRFRMKRMMTYNSLCKVLESKKEVGYPQVNRKINEEEIPYHVYKYRAKPL